jgi:hypothetical protein
MTSIIDRPERFAPTCSYMHASTSLRHRLSNSPASSAFACGRAACLWSGATFLPPPISNNFGGCHLVLPRPPAEPNPLRIWIGRISSVNEAGTAGAQQSFNFLDCFADNARWLPGPNLVF